MLGFEPFYYQHIRNVLLAFGAIFKDIQIVKYDKDTREELSRLTVPLELGGKETWLVRLMGDPSLNKGVQIVLPMMSYEMKKIGLDKEKQLTSYFNNSVSQSGNNASKFQFGVPYDMIIELNIYTRNMEDSTQIIEQILPFFTPDYTVSVKYLNIGGCSVVDDLPFILEDVAYDNKYEGAAGDVRIINWTLSFKAEMLFYGPTQANAAMIKTSTVNMKDFDSGNTQVTIVVEPNPISANSTDANLSYTTTITDELG